MRTSTSLVPYRAGPEDFADGYDGGPLRRALNAVRQRKLMVLSIALLAVLVAALGAMAFPRPYRASTSVVVVYNEEYSNLTTDGRLADTIRVALAEAMGTEMEILNTRALKADLVATLGPERMFPDRGPTPLERLWAATVGTPIAFDGLQAYAMDLLRMAGIDAAAAAADGGSDKPPPSPTDEAIEKLAGGLNIRRIEGSNVITIQYTHDDPMIAAQTLNTLVERFRALRGTVFSGTNRTALETEHAEAAAQLRAVEEKRNAFIQSTRSMELDQQMRMLTTERTTVLQELADPRKVISPEMRQEMRARVAQIDAQLQGLQRNAQQIERYNLEYGSALKRFELAQSVLGTTQMNEALQQVRKPTIRVIDRAVPPRRPVGLAAKVTVLLALVLGTLAGALLAVVLGPRRKVYDLVPSVRTIERHLGVPVLAIVDHRAFGD